MGARQSHSLFIRPSASSTSSSSSSAFSTSTQPRQANNQAAVDRDDPGHANHHHRRPNNQNLEQQQQQGEDSRGTHEGAKGKRTKQKKGGRKWAAEATGAAKASKGKRDKLVALAVKSPSPTLAVRRRLEELRRLRSAVVAASKQPPSPPLSIHSPYLPTIASLRSSTIFVIRPSPLPLRAFPPPRLSSVSPKFPTTGASPSPSPLVPPTPGSELIVEKEEERPLKVEQPQRKEQHAEFNQLPATQQTTEGTRDATNSNGRALSLDEPSKSIRGENNKQEQLHSLPPLTINATVVGSPPPSARNSSPVSPLPSTPRVVPLGPSRSASPHLPAFPRSRSNTSATSPRRRLSLNRSTGAEEGSGRRRRRRKHKGRRGNRRSSSVSPPEGVLENRSPGERLLDYLRRTLLMTTTHYTATEIARRGGRGNGEDGSTNPLTPSTLRMRVAALLTSPREVVSSPFLRLRRAASASAASLGGCCPSPSHHLHGYCGLGPLSAGSSPLLFSYPYPRSHTTLMLFPIGGAQPQPTPTTATGFAGYAGQLESRHRAQMLGYEGEMDVNSNIITDKLGAKGIYGEESMTTPQLIPRRPRPPLNRAIPPIPESRSNESIMSSTAATLNNNMLAGADATTKTSPETMLSLANDENNNRAKDSDTIEGDSSLVIENRMAQSLSTRQGSGLVAGGKQAAVPNRRAHPTPINREDVRERKTEVENCGGGGGGSGLASAMARSVRHNLSKWGTRLKVGSRSRARSPDSLQTGMMMRTSKSSPQGMAPHRARQAPTIPTSRSTGSDVHSSEAPLQPLRSLADTQEFSSSISPAMCLFPSSRGDVGDVPRRQPTALTLMPSARGPRLLPPPSPPPLIPPPPVPLQHHPSISSEKDSTAREMKAEGVRSRVDLPPTSGVEPRQPLWKPADLPLLPLPPRPSAPSSELDYADLESGSQVSALAVPLVVQAPTEVASIPVSVDVNADGRVQSGGKGEGGGTEEQGQEDPASSMGRVQANMLPKKQKIGLLRNGPKSSTPMPSTAHSVDEGNTGRGKSKRGCLLGSAGKFASTTSMPDERCAKQQATTTFLPLKDYQAASRTSKKTTAKLPATGKENVGTSGRMGGGVGGIFSSPARGLISAAASKITEVASPRLMRRRQELQQQLVRASTVDEGELGDGEGANGRGSRIASDMKKKASTTSLREPVSNTKTALYPTSFVVEKAKTSAAIAGPLQSSPARKRRVVRLKKSSSIPQHRPSPTTLWRRLRRVSGSQATTAENHQQQHQLLVADREGRPITAPLAALSTQSVAAYRSSDWGSSPYHESSIKEDMQLLRRLELSLLLPQASTASAAANSNDYYRAQRQGNGSRVGKQSPAAPNTSKHPQRTASKFQQPPTKPAMIHSVELGRKCYAGGKSRHGTSNGEEKALLAPLAVSESTRVKDSPAVEVAPVMGFNRATGLTTTKSGKGQKKSSGKKGRRSLFQQLWKGGNHGAKKEVKEETRNDESVMPLEREARVKNKAELASDQRHHQCSRETVKEHHQEPIASGKVSQQPRPLSIRPLAELLASPQLKHGNNNKLHYYSKEEEKTARGLIDDEIGDQPMLISASSSFQLIDDLNTPTTASSTHNMLPEPKQKPIRYIEEESSSAGSSAFRIAAQQGSHHCFLPKTTHASAMATVTPTAAVAPLPNGLSREVKEARGTMVNECRTWEERNIVSNSASTSKQSLTTPTDGARFKSFIPTRATHNAGTTRPTPHTSLTNGVDHHHRHSVSSTTASSSLEAEAKSSDDANVCSPFPLPELLSEFKSQLSALQSAMKKDFEEIDRLRNENEELRLQLVDRDRLVQRLQAQMEALAKSGAC